MSADTNPTPTAEFEFTLEEQWAIHQAFLDYIEVAVRDDTDLKDPTIEIKILEKVEAGEMCFTAFELDRIRYECEHHIASVESPDRDRDPGQAVIEKIDRRCRTALPS